jgi:iron complex transport system ATP-binding protein
MNNAQKTNSTSLTREVSLSSVTVMGKNNRPRLQQVSCQFSAGEIIVLIGPNGAGKSSLLKTLAQQLKPSAGQVTIFGPQSATWSAKKKAQHVAMLDQKHQLSLPFTVSQILALSRFCHTSDAATNTQINASALEAFDCNHLQHHSYTELSGGEQQRVHLARTFAQLNALGDQPQGPGLLLLDEPTTALDLAHQKNLVSAIRMAAHNGLTVVVSLHDLSLASQLADRILCLQHGSVAAFGSVTQIITPTFLQTLFDTPIHSIQPPQTSKPLLYLDHSGQ